ncbi:Exonuclease RNase T and DNA polymerase III [Cellulomonas flavigena DSM 20109]|uniref:Oligoribonuclease n=1 Tax=Cellulomonas flavigena (strain ATCC 482 / DSM 20109 / BCRC 11376 / JCM 18109 / NBRC 3775 / NCIMB 8073 / NRS 134) TaxID=446466 RepID=D5UCC7_CELFN|nr:oligoribonuclease [Cellulomonas flavigena]ADG74241.1 Exonuclease RNase T and DNA polymerase III [Cellulomonas flavigena DSM 20109]
MTSTADDAPTTSPAPAHGAHASNDRIVWVDCEMTGLDLVHDALVEVAAVVTDSELNVLGDGVDVVIAPPAEALAQMNDFVRSMHTTSGLLPELEHGVTLEEAEAQVLEYVRTWVPDVGKAPLAGNSVGTDKAFLDRHMPGLVGHLHYRIIDVSSIKELARRWYPRVYFAAPEKNGGHRALADILESIDELRYYRAALLPAAPGPDSAHARRVAAQVAATSVKRGLLPGA